MSIIGFLFSTVSFVVAAGYMPQTIRLWRAKTTCDDISIPAWSMWSYTSIVTLLYGIFELPDLKFILLGTVNVIFINAILGITIYKRRKYAPKQPTE